MAEEGLHFLCTEALNGFQRVLHRASSTTLAMEAVDEAVRFVSRMHQHASVTVEDDGVVPRETRFPRVLPTQRPQSGPTLSLLPRYA